MACPFPFAFPLPFTVGRSLVEYEDCKAVGRLDGTGVATSS